jgi:diguanylate cyclase (GGDEF)-like protein
VYRAYAQFLRQHKSLTELYDLTQAIGDAGSEDKVADVVLVRVRALLQAESATLWLPPKGRHPEVLLSAKVDYSGLLDSAATPDTLRRQAMEAGETVAVGPKLGTDELRAQLREQRVKDAIVVPLRSGSAVIGTLEVAGRLGDIAHFSPDDVRLLETLAAHAAVAVENSRLVDRLRFDAYHDALTVLPNRRRMLAALDEAVKVRAPGEVVAVLVFDVAGLRDVNDSLGHTAGDRVLVEVANRLRTLAPPGALVGRIGGDEFALSVRTASAETAVELAETVRTALRDRMVLGSLTIHVDAAVGVAVHPDHGADAATLLQRADVATHAAKSVTSAVQVFNPGLESRSVRRLGLAADLRRALERGELEVYFQPKVGLRDRRLVGVECLARWEHPVHGSVAPEDFVAVAEHTGQVGRLTEVVLREGLRRVRDWAEWGRPLSVAVNLSPRSLVDPSFPATVGELLDEYGVPPQRLTLEITEAGVVGDPDRPLPILYRLRDLGVRLSVDDFGAGYSSLAYLRRLPVHEVKVDRAFVQGMATDPGDLAIVRAIVDLSRHFGLSVVAEGVESELTLGLLEDIGCDVGQGFLFSRPLPHERLDAWFSAQTEAEPSPAGEVRWLRAVT